MAGTLERISFSTGGAAGASEATIALHMERYRFAGKYAVGGRTLDIACGVGYGSRILKECGALSVIGVDIAPEAVEEARSSGNATGVEFFCLDYRELADLTRVPAPLAQAFGDGFDAIVSLETIEHLPDPGHFIRTVTAGLRKGGRFIGSVPVTPSMDANPFHLQDFSPGSFRRLLEGNGLRVIDSMRQRQPFNPVTVKREMHTGERSGLRSNLLSYYVSNPSKLWLRLASTVRHGFVNLYDVVVAEKL